MIRAVVRGFARRCPRCGYRPVFLRWFTLLPACPGCGLVLEREEGHWLGAMAINLAITEAVFGAIVVGGIGATWPDVAWTAIWIAGILANITVPVLVYGSAKTAWTAIDLLMQEHWGREGTRGPR